MKRVWVLGILIAAALLLVAGCAGEAGKDGADGRDGIDVTAAPATATETCALCHGPGDVVDIAFTHSSSAVQNELPTRTVTLSNAAISAGGVVTVDVAITETSFAGDTEDVVDLASNTGDLRFGLVQLVPAAGGDASVWAPYIVSSSSGNASSQRPSTSGTSFVATSTPGTYTFTFNLDATLGAYGEGHTGTPNVAYNAANTHRIAMQHSGTGYVSTNAYLDFLPAGGAVTVTRNIVQTSVCQNCHGENFVFHGNRKIVELCTTCHNPTTADADTGNTADFKVMIHKIHAGTSLPSVVAGGTYIIGGNDYSHMNLPQPINNCTTCHSGSGAEVDNWKEQPTVEACGSCHDDVDFTAGTNHPPGAVANGSCFNATCHTNTDAGTSKDIVSTHGFPSRMATEAARYAYAIDSATYASSTGILTITFHVNYDGTAMDLTAAGGPWTQLSGGASRLQLSVAWGDDAQWSNDGSGQSPGNPVSINALDVLTGTNTDGVITDNLDGTYTTTYTLPTDARAAGTGIVSMDGHPASNVIQYAGDDADTGANDTTLDRLPVTNAFVNFAITDSSAATRPAIVDIAKCNKCHSNLSLHGNNRTGSTQVCVVCHNANNTDITRREAAAPVGTLDGKKEQSIMFGPLVHAIHGAGKRGDDNPIVVWGYGSTEHEFNSEHVHYPNRLAECNTCHAGTGTSVWDINISTGILGMTVDSDPTAATKGASVTANLLDHADDLNVSPTAAFCNGCHDDYQARWHMENVGGASFSVLQENITTN